MCGIVAIIDLRARRQIDRDTLVRMNESQHHRGPDEGGLHLAPGVGLGNRRLSIIDLATGQQPLYNADRSVVVIFNLRQLFEQHPSGSRDDSAPLWSLLMFDAFFRQMDATYQSAKQQSAESRVLSA